MPVKPTGFKARADNVDWRRSCRMRHRKLVESFHIGLPRQRLQCGSTNHLIVQMATSFQLRVRDWVRTADNKIGRVASINAITMTARIEALDDTHQSVVVLKFPLARLVKIDVEKYIPAEH